MAGGSADAAGALVACDALWVGGLPRAELVRLAAMLGSDVPFSVLGGTAIGRGRGERLQPVAAPARLHWVFALAGFGLSTPAVHRECDRRCAGRVPAPRVRPDLLDALARGDVAAVGGALHNDVQDAALGLRPELRDVLAAGAAAGALGAVLAGTSATCAFLARDERSAGELARALDSAGVCRAVRRASGPVEGPRVSVG